MVTSEMGRMPFPPGDMGSSSGPRRHHIKTNQCYDNIIERYVNEVEAVKKNCLGEPIFGISASDDHFFQHQRKHRQSADHPDENTARGNIDNLEKDPSTFQKHAQTSKINLILKQIFVLVIAASSSAFISRNFLLRDFNKISFLFSRGTLHNAENAKNPNNLERPKFVFDHPYVTSSYYRATKSIITLEKTNEIQIEPKKDRLSDSDRGIVSRLAIVRPFCEFDAEALPTTFACWNSLVPCRAAEDDLGNVDNEETDEWVIFDRSVNGTGRKLNTNDEGNWECDDKNGNSSLLSGSATNSFKRCKRKQSDKSYFDDVPADGLRTTSADLFLFYSQTFSDNEVAMNAVDEIMNEFFSPGGWSKCFDNIYAIEANIPKELDLYIPAAQEELYNWVNGPNRQFEAAFRIIQSGEWGDYDGFYLMEGDSVPVKNYWLDVILGEINAYKPFAVLGAQYDGDKWDAFYEQIPISLLHHTNGNGIYNTSHPLLERLVGQLEVEAPCPYNSIPYDYRMSQMWVEGTLGIVPKLAPKIMLNEEGENITLSDNKPMFTKWAKRWEDEEPYRFTKAIHNYAATNLIPRHLGPEYVIHGAKLYSPWDPSKIEITLVVSDWFFDRSLNLIKSLDSKDHPFSKVVIMIPPSVSNEHDYSKYTRVPVTLQYRDAPDFMDLCSAQVSTKWFMITNSYHLVANHVDLMFTPGKFVPVIPFTPATYPFCLKYPYCNEIIKLSHRWNPKHKQVVLDMDMLYNTDERNSFCQEWVDRNGVHGEDLYSKYEPVRYKHRGEKIIGPKGPTGTDYLAYLAREKKDGMYKMTDRSLYGARAPFVKVYRKEEKLDGMSEDELARRLDWTLMSNTTECSCDRFETEQDCLKSGLGCLWRPLFESCHPPEMIDDGVPICSTTDAPTLSPSVSIDSYLMQTASPTDVLAASDIDQDIKLSSSPPINRRIFLDSFFKSHEKVDDVFFFSDQLPITVGDVFRSNRPGTEISDETMKKMSGFDSFPEGDSTLSSLESGLDTIVAISCPTWGPSVVPRRLNGNSSLMLDPVPSSSGQQDLMTMDQNHILSPSPSGSQFVTPIVLSRARHTTHQLLKLDKIKSFNYESVSIPPIHDIKYSRINVKYDDNLDHLRVEFVSTALYSLLHDLERNFALKHEYTTKARISSLLNHILPSIAKVWSEALAIFRSTSPLFPRVTVCGDTIIPSDHLDDGVTDADTVIYVELKNPDLCFVDPFPKATICHFDQNMRPLFGSMSLCLEDMVAKDGYISEKEVMKKTAQLSQLVGNFLGLSPNLYRYFRNPETGELWGERTLPLACDRQENGNTDAVEMEVSVSNLIQPFIDGVELHYEITSPTVRQIVRNHFDCQDLNGARLSAPLPDPNNNDECTFFNLDLRFHFDDDLTTISRHTDFSMTISPLSLALLVDSSWYEANFSTATTPTFGRGAGCGFVKDVCISDGKIPEYSAGFFCNTSNEKDGSPSGCDYTHRNKAECDLMPNVNLPSDYVYFGQEYPDLGSPFEDVRYCPMRSKHLVSCSFQSMASNMVSLSGEYFDESSRCYETDVGSPVCLETICNSAYNIMEVVVKGEIFRCKFDGEVINVGLGYSIVCPRIAVVCPELVCPSNCSGRGVCDYCKEFPECICDDPFDSSAGCWG